jgi:2-polyprenyl-3-methyl-5-hydroxy-6-metoxy-1,4-benzoquinol methylase
MSTLRRLEPVAAARPDSHECRHCGAELTLVLADLGASPVANDLLAGDAHGAEPAYPLKVLVCSDCRLAQTADLFDADELFRADYTYFSSLSESWLEHARTYVDRFTARFGLGPRSQVVELACNDGYLLQYVKARGVPCLGVEPCRSVAEAAMARGIDVRVAFFGRRKALKLRAEGRAADLVVANNVLAHVPDINDFVGGVATLLKPEGVATFEVQHLLRLMERNQFDTIYHEHFTYLSLMAAQRVFEAAGLRVFDVDELPTHGGSIRFIVCRADASHATSLNVARVLEEERAAGLDTDEAYVEWAARVRALKRSFLTLMIGLKDAGKSICAYGAPAKGVTLLNYCGVGRDFIDFTVDRAPSKQGRLLPGVRLPIHAPEAILERKPDYVLILPWNLQDEIMQQMSAVRAWGGKFIVPIPEPRVLS